MDGYKTYDTTNGFGSARSWRDAFYERMTGEQAARILKSQEETPYSLLGISPGATQAEIKKAFRLKIIEWHPDKNQHRIKEATEMSQKIIAAYTVLSK